MINAPDYSVKLYTVPVITATSAWCSSCWTAGQTWTWLPATPAGPVGRRTSRPAWCGLMKKVCLCDDELGCLGRSNENIKLLVFRPQVMTPSSPYWNTTNVQMTPPAMSTPSQEGVSYRLEMIIWAIKKSPPPLNCLNMSALFQMGPMFPSHLLWGRSKAWLKVVRWSEAQQISPQFTSLSADVTAHTVCEIGGGGGLQLCLCLCDIHT